MFNFFKKRSQNKPIIICSPVDGVFKSIEDVADPVFSQKMMGEGFAVYPENNRIYSPVAGKIVGIFPTKHAISIETKEGVEILIHMGINTVELNGNGFDIKVMEGDQVDHNSMLALIDYEYLKKQDKIIDVIIVFTNLTPEQSISFANKLTNVTTSTEVATIV